VRTLVVSDLHLGAHRQTDVLRREGPLEALCAALEGVDRFVILGDALELRQGPERDVVATAAPILARLGRALRPDGEFVLVTGNHDHHLISPWLAHRALHAPPDPLGLERRLSAEEIAAAPALAALARAIDGAGGAGATLSVAFPGLWLREDVYALHGHYLDRLITLPTFERLATGAMAHVVGPLPAGRGAATAEHFEAALQPIYAWMHAVAQSPAGSWSSGTQTTSASAWKTLSGRRDGRRTVRESMLVRAFPLAVAALNRARLGPLNADISSHELRRAGLRALGEVVWRLGVDAEHVVFGHTHRAGPLPGDDAHEWRVPGTATRLHNPGAWVDEPTFAGGDHTSPYWAGRAIVIDDDGSPPRLERLVEDLG